MEIHVLPEPTHTRENRMAKLRQLLVPLAPISHSGEPSIPFFISRANVEHLMLEMQTDVTLSSSAPRGISPLAGADRGRTCYGIAGVEGLLSDLGALVKGLAIPHISNFYVGSAGLTNKGNIYTGVNVEFSNAALNQSIHSEQCLLSRVVAGPPPQSLLLSSPSTMQTHEPDEVGDAEYLTHLAVNAAPCGHCRQFLAEVYQGQDIIVIIGFGQNQVRKPLRELLPSAFTPSDLGNTEPVLRHSRFDLSLVDADHESDPLAVLALGAAQRSYAPYSHRPSGVAIKIKDGRTFVGGYIENAAFNPSLSPLQAAITGVVASQVPFEDIVDAVLCEIPREQGKVTVQQEDITRIVLRDLTPSAHTSLLRVCAVSNNKPKN
eukprot:TRINITY_DN10130_c0_g1_i1.p1 TRINITY_DN10130_c0_g1~~TRINITY_DN10130_c0_g1_i1.p1  ORF type:complete len:377 (-),score=44.17 TRINITY_DN10130_c0_g1_i1:23-1153(-)